jgi:hypothetical protein
MFLEPDSIHIFVTPHKLADVPNGKLAIFGLQKAGNRWLHSRVLKRWGYDI